MAFKFGLESVLKHRKRVAEAAQRDWAEAQAAVDACLKRIEEMYRRCDEVREEIMSLQKIGDVRSLNEVCEMEAFLRGQRIRIERARLEARELMAISEQKHEIFVEAARDKKILDKLKEKKMNQYREWLKQIEAKQLDDITMTRMVWRKS